MQISKEVHDLILDNIDKDILDVGFIDKLKEYLIKYNDLEPVIGDIYFTFDNKEYLGKYITETKDIILNKHRMTSAIHCIDNLIQDISSKQRQMVYNFYYLQTIFHEIIHAEQHKLLYCSNILVNDFYKKIIEDSWKAKAIDFKYSIFKKDKTFYGKYHDVFPDEVEADVLSAFNIYELLDLIKFDNIILRNIIFDNFIYGYKLKMNKIINPLSSFYKKSHIKFNEKDYNLCNYSLKDKFSLGLVNDENEIYEVLKTCLGEKISQDELINDFKERIKVLSIR